MSKGEKRDHAREELVQAFQSLLDTKADSDLTIICRDQRFDVHSLIVGSRSDFFRAAYKSGFKEAVTRTVELKEDDPSMVARMIQYLYTLDYDDSSTTTLRPEAEPQTPALGAFGVDVHMYIMGDKYGSWGLKKTAEAKFEKVITQRMDVSEYLPVVAKIYGSTPENDRGLRDVVVRLAGFDLAALTKSKQLKGVLAVCPDFAYDIITWASQNATKPTTTFLGACRGCHDITFGKMEKLRCADCGYLKNAPS